MAADLRAVLAELVLPRFDTLDETLTVVKGRLAQHDRAIDEVRAAQVKLEADMKTSHSELAAAHAGLERRLLAAEATAPPGLSTSTAAHLQPGDRQSC